MKQIEIFPVQHIGNTPDLPDCILRAKARIKRLGSVADRQVIQLHKGDRRETVITQGWRYKNLVVVPEMDSLYTPWMIVHQPSGYPVLAAQHSHLLGAAIGSEICQTVESVRAIALLLSKLGVPEQLNKRNVEALRDLFKESGIEFRE